jgi:hypothetical protein
VRPQQLLESAATDVRSVGSLAMTSRGLDLYVSFDKSAQCLNSWHIGDKNLNCGVEQVRFEEGESLVRWKKKVDGQNKKSASGRRANVGRRKHRARTSRSRQLSANATGGVGACATLSSEHEDEN